MSVYCDMVTNGGGWVVFQNRFNGSVDFDQDWNSYKRGFGNLSGEFWLGNDNIHRLTTIGGAVLRIELRDRADGLEYAEYRSFMVDGECNKYKLTVGSYSGTTQYNALDLRLQMPTVQERFIHNGRYFTTKDRDNDVGPGANYNCAVSFGSGWWFGGCVACNLNAPYSGDVLDTSKIPWHGRGSNPIKKVQMKVRSLSDSP